MPRPAKPPEEHVLRTCIAYRPDQSEKVRELQKEKRLSTICQAAIDAA